MVRPLDPIERVCRGERPVRVGAVTPRLPRIGHRVIDGRAVKRNGVISQLDDDRSRSAVSEQYPQTSIFTSKVAAVGVQRSSNFRPWNEGSPHGEFQLLCQANLDGGTDNDSV